MIVVNRNRTTAIVIGHNGHQVTLVAMRSGKLSTKRMAKEQFDTEWQALDYPLASALEQFMRHARQKGASREAEKGLKRLAERDRWVVVPLF